MKSPHRQSLAGKIGGLMQKRAWRLLAGAALLTSIPFGSWLVGSGVASVVPNSYRSTAVVRLPGNLSSSAIEHEKARMRSREVVNRAALSLSGQSFASRPDPMQSYMLWSSLETGDENGPLVRLAMRGTDAESTRRRLEAVVQAYQSVSQPSDETASSATYFAPIESSSVRVSDDTRVLLGLSAFAIVALALSIPLLKQMERFAPHSPATA